MTMKKKKQLLCEDNLRHNEYYGMQNTIDNLYQASLNGEVFTDLMSVILQRENILLAYRNIKKNTGSKTSGTDNLTIEDIGRCSPDEVVEKVRFIINGSEHGYRPKPVRRKEIPKPYDPSKMRPLGIPCIWDRLVQQCIKQVLEPVCEAKFSKNSYGFRPNHSVENAIARSYQLLQHANLHYVIEFDIKGFFDNVNHAKLIRQIWAMGIHDKQLIFVIRRILKAPIKLEDGTFITPDKGTPQGGIISPLLANIVLNELDHWVESQWQWCPICKRNARPENGFRQAKKSNLKEMFIVRYADYFRIFCRTKDSAERTKCAVTLWLKERLKLEISEKKTRIVNVRNHYSDFLGFKMKVHRKGNKLVVISHIADKNLEHKREKLKEQAKRIVHPRKIYGEQGEIRLYNSMVTGMQNYYCMGTHVIMNGVEYVVEDTGAFARYGVQFDVYYGDHASASAHGHQTWEAYIADSNGSQEVEVTTTREVNRLDVTLTNHNLDAVLRNRMTDKEQEQYDAYNKYYGNRDYLFDINSIPTGGAGFGYDIPAEALSDPQFAKMIREAEKYLGYPYVWGGASPSTSFDCSGFVCWVINNCGNGWNVGRTTADGLRSYCSYVSPSDAKPGDLIFFQGTYDTPGASHVGIYVGNNMMIHCGNPIQYTSIASSYWQQHFMAFGRIH